jgi:hypothetical protein
MKVLVLLSLLAWGTVHAQAIETDDVPARIAAARAQLQQQRQAIEQQHEERRRECWQRFAVNDCLREVRRSRYQALDPLRPQELELNAQEREWRTRQRDERLRNKQDAVRQP